MDRGAMLAESHDHILRKLPETTGKSLAHWFGVLEKKGVRSFFGGLDLLRDQRKVPHSEASAIAYAFLNPYMVPDDLRRGPRRRAADLDRTLAKTEKANKRLRAPAEKALRAAAAARKSKLKVRAKAATATRKAAPPAKARARVKPPARRSQPARRPMPAKPARRVQLAAKPSKARKVAKRSKRR